MAPPLLRRSSARDSMGLQDQNLSVHEEYGFALLRTDRHVPRKTCACSTAWKRFCHRSGLSASERKESRNSVCRHARYLRLILNFFESRIVIS